MKNGIKFIVGVVGTAILGMAILKFMVMLWAPLLLFGLFYLAAQKYGISLLYIGVGVMGAIACLWIVVHFGLKTMILVSMAILSFTVGRKLINLILGRK